MSCECTDPCQPNSTPCTCEARVTSDCVTVSGVTSSCLAIDNNLLLTDYLTQMDERICEKVDSVTNFIALENVGTGSELYKGDSLLGKKQIRTIKSIDSSLTVNQTADEVQLDINIPDATSSVKGLLRLTGDLGGTADAPTTPTAVHLTGVETISDSKSFTSIIEITGVNSGIAFNTSTGWTTNYAFPMLTRTGSLFTLRGSASGDSNRYGSIFDNNLLTTVDRTFTFPDKNGVFALTSDLNLQREITTSTVISNTDNNYIIFINNGSTPITITINSSITTSNFCVGFIQEGTGDVTFVGSGVSLTNPIGLKSKGQGYQTFIERKLATSNFYLLGNTRI